MLCNVQKLILPCFLYINELFWQLWLWIFWLKRFNFHKHNQFYPFRNSTFPYWSYFLEGGNILQNRYLKYNIIWLYILHCSYRIFYYHFCILSWLTYFSFRPLKISHKCSVLSISMVSHKEYFLLSNVCFLSKKCFN